MAKHELICIRYILEANMEVEVATCLPEMLGCVGAEVAKSVELVLLHDEVNP